jgi:hypothetical protein
MLLTAASWCAYREKILWLSGFVCACLLVSAGLAAELPSPTAQFTFDGKRCIGKAVLNNITNHDRALYLNGKYSTWYDGDKEGEGYTAVFRPVHFDYRKFTVAVKVQPEDIAERTLLVGGTSYRWLALRVNSRGQLQFSLNNDEFRRPIEGVKVARGEWISIAVSFDLEAREVVVYVNGARASLISLPKDFKLAILDSEIWREHDKVWTFTNYSYGGTFHGLVAELLSFDTVLSDEQVHQLFQR